MTERRPRFRILSAEELALWKAAMADVRPSRRGGLRRRLAEASQPAAEKEISAQDGRSPLRPAVARPKIEPPPPPSQRAGVSDIDQRTRLKLRRGRLEVDAKLDLHGYRQAEAHRALVEFLRRAQAAGAKMAIVVTGKGQSGRVCDLEQPGVLRRMTPIWLQSPNLRDVVASFGEASRHHGGEGALYVQIRRADRRSGRQ